jgi:hypothetical protein
VRHGRGQRQQVGLGAAVGESQQRHGRKALHDLARQFYFAQRVRRQAQPAVQRRHDGLANGRRRMPVQAGGELAQAVEQAVAVGVPQPAALAAHHRQRERRLEQHAARVAAGHDFGSFVELAGAGGVAGAVAFDGSGEGGVQRG